MKSHPTVPALVAEPGVAPSGVFDADPHTPPPIPAGARAVEIRDTTGRVIAFAWVVAEHADDSLALAAWRWLDEHAAIAAPQPRHLSLHRP